MLRVLVTVLLLANAAYYAWSQGLLRPWGLAPQEQSEPQRLGQQLRPEALQILKESPSQPVPAASDATPPAQAASDASTAQADATAAPPAPVSTPPAVPTECLQAGVFDERQAQALRTAAASLPQGSWVLEPSTTPGRWMVYMGRFEDLEALDKKRAELRARKVEFVRAGGTLEPGLSLGRFSTEAAAKRALANLSNKGVRTARVVQERPETTGFTLRLPAVNDTLRAQLDALRPAMAGKTLQACE